MIELRLIMKYSKRVTCFYSIKNFSPQYFKGKSMQSSFEETDLPVYGIYLCSF